MLLLLLSEPTSVHCGVTQPADAPSQSHRPVTAFTKPSPESAAVETAVRPGQSVVPALTFGSNVPPDVFSEVCKSFSDSDDLQPHLPVTAMTTKLSPEVLVADKPAQSPGSAPKASGEDQHPAGPDLFIQYRIKQDSCGNKPPKLQLLSSVSSSLDLIGITDQGSALCLPVQSLFHRLRLQERLSRTSPGAPRRRGHQRPPSRLYLTLASQLQPKASRGFLQRPNPIRFLSQALTHHHENRLQ